MNIDGKRIIQECHFFARVWRFGSCFGFNNFTIFILMYYQNIFLIFFKMLISTSHKLFKYQESNLLSLVDGGIFRVFDLNELIESGSD